MSLQFVIGGSGSGKSRYVYRQIIQEAAACPGQQYYVIVPEQFTMQTQKTLVEMNPGRGILNIDVLSFQRLAYRVFEEAGSDTRRILEDTGKSMVIRRIAQEEAARLPYLGSQLRKPGCIDEIKSLISEFMQYCIHEQELMKMIGQAPEDSLLALKLKDIATVYTSFRRFIAQTHVTAEELLEAMLPLLPFSGKVAGSTMVFDGFTGFTPVQLQVLESLMKVCGQVRITVTMDPEEMSRSTPSSRQLFSMSHRMIRSVSDLTTDLETPVLLKADAAKGRFAYAPALFFLERNLFRYNRKQYGGAQQNRSEPTAASGALSESDQTAAEGTASESDLPSQLSIFSADTPVREMEEIARRIRFLVRTRQLRYGEMAVITGNLEEYAPKARQVFERSGIPFFIDEKHNVLLNPFVEFLRAALEMVDTDFSYESVLRFLRSGMTDLSRNEIDRLENYIRALGIRGWRRWTEKWVRLYRGMEADGILRLNESRERFVNQVRSLSEGLAGGSRTIREYATLVYEFLETNYIQQKLEKMELDCRQRGDHALEKENAQVFGVVISLLEKMVEILGEEKVSCREFRQLLETGLEQQKIGLIPISVDHVLIGDIERTRLKDIRVLFFAGVNEGNVPKDIGSGGFLSETDRDFFEDRGVELAPDAGERMLMSRFYLYQNLTKPSMYLCISSSMSSSLGEPLRPAWLINSLLELFPQLRVEQVLSGTDLSDRLEFPSEGLAWLAEHFGSGTAITALSHGEEPAFPATDPGGRDFENQNLRKQDQDCQAGNQDKDLFSQDLIRWYNRSEPWRSSLELILDAAFACRLPDSVGPVLARRLYGEISPYAATRFEQYRACACAHFLQYGLRLTERQEYEFRSADMGNVMHEALWRFSVRLEKENLTWQQLEDEQRDQLVDQAVDEAVNTYQYDVLRASRRSEARIFRIRRILRRTVWALQHQLSHGTFHPEHFELAFEGGRIDRVDIDRKDDMVYVRVVDYKSGSTAFDLNKVYYGLQLQLMLYLDAAEKVCQKEYPQARIVPAGVFYYSLKDPVVTVKEETIREELDQMLLKQQKMSGLATSDTEILKRMDSTLQSLPAGIKKDGSLTKASMTASEEQFRQLQEHVRGTLTDSIGRILEGDAQTLPVQLEDSTPCTWCSFHSACGFDRRLPGYGFRRLEKLTKDQIWQIIQSQ